MASVTGVTDGALVIEPGDTLVILCAAPGDHREDLGKTLSAAMPGVRVEVLFLWRGGPTLLYRPNRDRPRTDTGPTFVEKVSFLRDLAAQGGPLSEHAASLDRYMANARAAGIPCGGADCNCIDDRVANSILDSIARAVGAEYPAATAPVVAFTFDNSDGRFTPHTNPDGTFTPITFETTVEVPERVDELPTEPAMPPPSRVKPPPAQGNPIIDEPYIVWARDEQGRSAGHLFGGGVFTPATKVDRVELLPSGWVLATYERSGMQVLYPPAAVVRIELPPQGGRPVDQ